MNADELGKLLDELGKRLGPAGTHVYDVLVRQAVISSTIWIWVAGIIVAASVFVILLALLGLFRHWISGSDASGIMAFIVLVNMFALPALAVNFITLNNPEYQAIKDLLTAIPH